jgi:hypothetical protein
MRWRLRRLAGSPVGDADYVNGTFDEARFSFPVDLALSADEQTLYVADVWNVRIREIHLEDDSVTAGLELTDIPRRDLPGEVLSGRPRNMSMGPDGILRVTANNIEADQPGVIVNWDPITGDATSALSTAGGVGGIAHDPGGTTATVKIRLGEAETGWGTLALSGPNQDEITEPPVLPDPPFCDPPANTIPVQVMRVREGEPTETSGLERIGPIVVAFEFVPTGAGVVAFDPWNETTNFPSPYTTCDTPTDPTSIAVPCIGDIATGVPPWSATRGPDDPETGLPTVVGAPWRSANGLLLRAVVDIDNATLQVDYRAAPGYVDIGSTGVAYSPSRDTYYISTADIWGDPGPNAPPHQILALEYVSDVPIFTGGSGRIPIRTPLG